MTMGYSRCLFITLLFLVFSFDGFGQKEVDQDKVVYSMADTIEARRYLDSAEVLNKFPHYDLALAYGMKALKIYQRFFGEEHAMTAKTYFTIARVFEAKNNLSSEVVEFYLKAIDIQLKVYGEEDLTVAKTYQRLAFIYAMSGKYETALKYSQLTLFIYQKKLERDHPDLLKAYDMMALTHNLIKEYDKSLEYLFVVLDLRLEKFGKDHPEVGKTYHSIGYKYENKKEYDKAIEFYQKDIDTKLTYLESNHKDLIRAYRSAANVYKKIREYDIAIKYSQKALDGQLAIEPLRRISVGSAYENLGELYFLSGLYKKAIEVYEQGLYHLELELKLRKPIKSGRLPFALLLIRDNLKRSIRSVVAGAKSDPVNFDLKQAFIYSEKTKSNIILQAFQNTKAKSFAGVPEEMILYEQALKDSIAFYEKTNKENFDEGFSNTYADILNSSYKINALYDQHEALVDSIEKKYPKYYQAKYDYSTVSVEEVQKNLLGPDQSLLAYSIGDSSIYIFLVQKDNYEILEVKKDFSIEELTKQLNQEGIYQYYTLPVNQRNREIEEKAIINYTEAAQLLYEKLIAPVKEKLTKSVIIIPQSYISFIPFEALLTKRPARIGAFSTYPFLLYDHEISYCYSATLLREMKQKQHQQTAQESLLAMAPFFQDDVETLVSLLDTSDLLALRDSLDALPASGKEVAFLEKIMPGKSLYGTEASLDQFKTLAGQYQILHLSTHGKVDKKTRDYSFLAFGVPDKEGSFDKLYARELYNFSLNADMVVLSACETGIGSLYGGEGVFSLARAFAFAGAKSVFTTLWQINDEKTKDLIIYFYKYLKKGETKDEALRNAKLKFLKRNKGEALHPFFWAGMIGIGDMSAISSDD
jgi:CHAT domain-containing protein/tetratricopeptide (TPR) repeat protein